jgi:hypothetical protein
MSIGINMNIETSTNKDQVQSLLILNKQEKMWATYNPKSLTWAFYILNNGDFLVNM